MFLTGLAGSRETLWFTRELPVPSVKDSPSVKAHLHDFPHCTPHAQKKFIAVTNQTLLREMNKDCVADSDVHVWGKHKDGQGHPLKGEEVTFESSAMR